MAMKFDARLEMDVGRVTARMEGRVKLAQQWLDNEVLKSTEPYVPMRIGTLARSGPGSTNPGSGEITYDTPYAKRMYYGNYHFSKTAHPQATGQWFEKSKAVNRDAWLRGVERIIKG